MRRIQVHVAQRLEVDAGGTHELDRAVDVFGQRLVARVGRIRHETLVPPVHLTQIRVSALRESADQVQRRRRMVIQGQEALRVGLARLRGELKGVHRVAAVARQRQPSRVSRSEERGLAYCPAMRPTLMTGRDAP